MFALGILTLVRGDFSPVWEPVPKTVPARGFLVYLCALISLASGIGLLFRRTAGFAARILLAFLLFWWLLFRVPDLFLAPASQGSWSGCGETAVILAGAWVLYVRLATNWDQQRLPFAARSQGMRIARVLYGLSLIPFGTAHFVYLHETAALVPAWLPMHVAWAAFTGSAFIAAGLAIVIGVGTRLAIVLSAWQIGLFVLLVWIPILAAGSKDAYQWSETILSWALTAAAWVVAESCRNLPWLSPTKRERTMR
jgi:uncharacterized membrane protein